MTPHNNDRFPCHRDDAAGAELAAYRRAEWARVDALGARVDRASGLAIWLVLVGVVVTMTMYATVATGLPWWARVALGMTAAAAAVAGVRLAQARRTRRAERSTGRVLAEAAAVYGLEMRRHGKARRRGEPIRIDQATADAASAAALVRARRALWVSWAALVPGVLALVAALVDRLTGSTEWPAWVFWPGVALGLALLVGGVVEARRAWRVIERHR